MDKKNIGVLAVVGLIFLLTGFGLGKSLQKQAEPAQSTDNQQEIDWLKSQLEVFYPSLPEEVFRLSGNVVQKQDESLTMEAYVRVSQFPLPEGKESEKQIINVKLSGETEIYRLELIVDPLLLEGAVEPFKKLALRFEDIKIGDLITVVSGENIKDRKEIMVKEIQINF
ncbi:MAG TPA: hypothetical protein VMW21_02920 [Patescibacteria group bacterium]|nr:hypothetical protein [Patescibacteria group bacterium]